MEDVIGKVEGRAAEREMYAQDDDNEDEREQE
jgi:hypothetical protein